MSSARSIDGKFVLATLAGGALLLLILCAFTPDRVLVSMVATVFGVSFLVFCALSPLKLVKATALIYAPLSFILGETVIGQAIGFDLTVSRVFGLLLLAGLTVRLTADLGLRRLKRLSAPAGVYLAFAVYLVASSAFSPSLNDALGDGVRFLAGLVVFLVVQDQARDWSVAGSLMTWMQIGITLSSATTILMWLSGSAAFVEFTHGVARIMGAMGSVNNSGNLAVLGIALLLPNLSGRPHRQSTIAPYLIVAGVHALTIAVTVSRTAILGTILLLFCWLLLDEGIGLSRVRKTLVAIVAVIVVIAALQVVGFDTIEERFEDVPGLGASIHDPSAGSGRIGIWSAYAGAYRRAPLEKKLLGHGLGSTWILGAHVEPGALLRVKGPHNEYLWLLLETGVVGLLIYLSFLVAFVLYIQRARRFADAPASEIRAVLTAALAYLLSYQLTKEFFGWGIVQMGVRWYVMLYWGCLLGLAHHVLTGAKTRKPSARSEARPTPHL